MNTFHNPPTDDASLAAHAKQLSSMSDAERKAYLDDFSGRRTPAPKSYRDNERGKSLRELLGESATKALIADANLIKAEAAKQATP